MVIYMLNKPASSKTLSLVGVSIQGFFSLTTFTRDDTINTYYLYVTLTLALSSDARRGV
jgi:hypothetical protein